MIDDPMNRLKVLRGSQLPQSKFDEDTVREIRELVAQREEIKLRLKNLTNAAIARKLGVHVRTIEKITQMNSWLHA